MQHVGIYEDGNFIREFQGNYVRGGMQTKAIGLCTIMRVSPMPVKKHFQPGESVPDTGVYAAIHDGHRLTHQVTLRKGEFFPLCSRCTDRVRFELVTSGSSIRNTGVRKKRAGH